MIRDGAMVFPLLEAEDLIRMVETDTVRSCSYEASKSILSLLLFAAVRESHRTPLSLSGSFSGPADRHEVMSKDEVLSVLKFLVAKRLELTYTVGNLDVKWGRLAAWCLCELDFLLPLCVFPEDKTGSFTEG